MCCWIILTGRRLELTEDRRLSRGKAHVARRRGLAANASYAALNLRDGERKRIVSETLTMRVISVQACGCGWSILWRI
jgi:hypothetical protein